MNLLELIEKSLPILESRTIEKIEGKVEEGEVKIYWCGTIIRIDLKPRERDL